MIKKAAAITNQSLGVLSPEIAKAIINTCDEILAGNLSDQFVIETLNSGASTAFNMNCNEVIANRALEILGKSKGAYEIVSPNDHVNMGQSTNDVYPTAIHVALILHNGKVIKEAKDLSAAFHKIGDKYSKVLKMGRTEGQDAVPMTVGQEFHGFGNQLDAAIDALTKSEEYLYEENMGATAIGTGITASPGYAEKCATRLAEITGKPMHLSKDLIAATSSMQAFVMYSAGLKNLAVTLSKISSDLIFLCSGPRTGIFEINLPALQPGSSIMPGKVNPVMPELMNQICYKVIGNDFTVTIASRDGLLQLNAYEPVVAVSIMESQGLLFKTLPLFRKQCIEGITVNEKVLQHYMERSVGIVTALNPVLGYDKTTELAKEALDSGKGILELIREKKLLTEQQIKDLLDPVKLTTPTGPTKLQE